MLSSYRKPRQRPRCEQPAGPGSVGGALAGLLSRLRRRHEDEEYEYEDYEDEYEDDIEADIIIADEDYDLSPSSFLPGEDIDDAEEYEDDYYADDAEVEAFEEDDDASFDVGRGL